MSNLLEGLNENQKQAVMTTEGMIQICSVAGSGKTRVLVNRTAYMIKEKGINPSSMMLTTFTKKATDEMKERLTQLIDGDELNSLTLGTTHSIGYRILKEEYRIMNHPLANAFKNPNVGVIKSWKQKKFIEDEIKIMEKMNPLFAKELKGMKLPMILGIIGNAKNNNIDYMQFEQKHATSNTFMQVMSQLYRAYEMKKQEEKLIDFDDMLFLLVRLFQENNGVLKKYQDKFHYIMVDEAQDNNLLQYQMVSMLTRPHYNLFVVGDDDQSMYKFRGANPQSFIEFKSSYDNKVKQIPLMINYRSNSSILETANKLIRNNINRIEKELVPYKESNEKGVFYNVYQDEAEEASNVIAEIKTLNQNGIDYKKIAILYRTNAQSRSFEDELIFAGIPYTLHGGYSFYERKEVKDLISFFQLAYDTNNNKAFQRIYNTPNRFLGQAFLRDIQNVKKVKSHFEAIDHLHLKGFQKNGANELKWLIKSLQNISLNGSLTDMINMIMENGYKDHLTDDNSSDEENPVFENVETLVHLLKQFDSLEEFIKHVESMTNKRKLDDKGVQLMTIHRSKGLEFPIVFSVGLSEGVLPHIRSIEAEDNGDQKENPIEEERRLAYVAVTRAENRCYISSVLGFNGKDVAPSRFTNEMALEPEVREEESAEEVI
jgi:DNA helicase-2/ATP-dependent DNA helicase PcrA